MESFAWSKEPAPGQEETLAYICDEVCKYREGRTQEELDAAMAREPEVPVPVMASRTIDWLGLTLSCPYVWVIDDSDEEETSLYSRYEDDNAWDMSMLYLSGFTCRAEGAWQI